MPSADSSPQLQVRGLRKRYGHVEALRGVDLDVPAGQVVGLVGDNGAGKSTLIKILSGAQQPDSGTILVRGNPARLRTPATAREAGVETVFQDLALAPDLDATGNLFLGRERGHRGVRGFLGWIDRAGMRREAAATFRELAVDIKDIDAPVASYSGGQRQGVAVARAAHWAHTALLLDEPTAALGVVQTQQVLDLIKRVRDRGIGVVLVSHNLPDVLAVSDRIVVLRLGASVADLSATSTTTVQLVAAMTGAAEYDSQPAAASAQSPAVAS